MNTHLLSIRTVVDITAAVGAAVNGSSAASTLTSTDSTANYSY